jgi:hypothetical protein
MRPFECEFEPEVVAAALQSRWPERVEAHLRAHAAACPVCSDAATIACAIDGAREEMRARTMVPDSGRVWRLARMRARREAAKAAGRPITAAQVIAFACAAGLLGACFGATSTWFQAALGRITSSVAGFKIPALLPSATTVINEHGALVLAMAAVLLVVSAAVYLVMPRD